MRKGFGKCRFGPAAQTAPDGQHLRYAPANGRFDRLYLPKHLRRPSLRYQQTGFVRETRDDRDGTAA